MFVDVAVVLAWAESSVFLFDKEKGGGLRGVGRADLSRRQVLIQKVFGSFSLIGGKGVYLPNLRCKGIIKVDLVIVGSRGGNVIGSFF